MTRRLPHPILYRLILNRAVLAGCVLLLAGCSFLAPPPQLRGNHVTADELKELVPGTSTQADVRSLLGSPTAHATFDDNTWLYISESTQTRIGQTPAVLKQKVVALQFNDSGVLENVNARDKANGLPVQVIARTTPSPGTNASFFQQLFGNIGRFNAGGLGDTGTSSGGGGAPTPY